MERVRVAAIQTGPGGTEPATVRSLVAGADGLDLVVLPELCHLPYFPLELNDEWGSKAITLDNPFLRELGSIAAEHGCHILAGVFLEDEDGKLFNAAVLVGPEGSQLAGRNPQGVASLAIYRKVHLCDVDFYGATFHESAYFTPGDAPLLWDLPFGTVGVLICYDRHFPEAWRTLRASGADIVCVPTASPSATERTFVPEMQAMALQQGIYAVVANRAGKETLLHSRRTTEYLGCSCVIGPDGRVLTSAPGRQPDVLISVEIEPDALDRTRSGLPLEQHRRPDTYVLDPVSTRG
ncbi:MAG: carbon-nitrogen hydrolase family protein [Dehalococcoidia bacterium]